MVTVFHRNSAQSVLAEGGIALGCVILKFGTADTARLLHASGFQYAFIDLEHGCLSLETVQPIIRAATEAGIAPIVRVSELLYSLVARALDAGAQGIILPRVEDPIKLEEAVRWMKFPPSGVRGFGISPGYLGYSQCSMADTIKHLDTTTITIVQIETRAAVERCEELLSVHGVDIAMIGPSDLSISFGVPGDFENPAVLSAIEHCMEVCERRGVVPGIQVRTVASARQWIERGMRFVGCGTDEILLYDRACEVVSSLRSVVRPPALSA